MYTNQPEVELFVNGVSAGARAVENRTARWEVALANGPNSIRAQAGPYEDRVTIVYADRLGGGFFAVNAGAHYGYVDDSHIYWEPDRAYTPGSWGYIGEGKAARTHHRVFATADDPLFQASRQGMEAYQFDVEDGMYQVTLGFAASVQRAAVNGQTVLRELVVPLHTATLHSIVTEARGGQGIRIEVEGPIAAIKVRRKL